jgi:hypothetical protein
MDVVNNQGLAPCAAVKPWIQELIKPPRRPAEALLNPPGDTDRKAPFYLKFATWITRLGCFSPPAPLVSRVQTSNSCRSTERILVDSSIRQQP